MCGRGRRHTVSWLDGVGSLPEPASGRAHHALGPCPARLLCAFHLPYCRHVCWGHRWCSPPGSPLWHRLKCVPSVCWCLVEPILFRNQRANFKSERTFFIPLWSGENQSQLYFCHVYWVGVGLGRDVYQNVNISHPKKKQNLEPLYLLARLIWLCSYLVSRLPTQSALQERGKTVSTHSMAACSWVR